MNVWTRKTPLSQLGDHCQVDEVWEYHPAASQARSFPMRVRIGKPLDVLALKGTSLQEVRDYSSFLSQMAQRLYGNPEAMEKQDDCPVCRQRLGDAPVALRVFQVPYLQCRNCGHVCVGSRPSQRTLDESFSESEGLSSVYIDEDAVNIRMEQIVRPKLEWCVDLYRSRYGRDPMSVTDVGAGGGHFLAGILDSGIRGQGFEKSKHSRAFAEKAFGIELSEDDFLTAPAVLSDIVTFWGLLEYVTNPREFIATAKNWLSREGMLVIEVPRVESLGTYIQGLPGSVIARHMDPTSHVNGFSDVSLCTALVEEEFSPMAAWYFGMDAYETCIQAALKSNSPDVLDSLVEFIPVIQRALDLGRQCDDIIIAAYRNQT